MQSPAAGRILPVVCLLLCGGPPGHIAVAAGGSAAEHPVGKVIGLLQDLIAKVEKEGQTEANTYAKFEYWCKSSETTLTKAIAEETQTIETLTATISAKTKEKKQLEDAIAGLEKQIADIEASQQYSQEERDAQHKEWAAADKDLFDTIAAVEECIAALMEAKGKVSFVQLSEKVRETLMLAETLAPEQTRPTIKALLQDPSLLQESSAAAGPAGAGPAQGEYVAHQQKYKFKSDNIIELLKQLKANFEDDKLEGVKAETNAQNAFELATASRKGMSDAAKAQKAEKEDILADVTSLLEESKATKKDTEEDKAADTKTLENTVKSCKIKATEWAERTKTRELEIEAMHKAIEILSEVSGVRTEAPENPVPPPSPLEANDAFFLQLGGADPKMKAVNLLRAEARATHSLALERLAQEVAAHLTGPFDEVSQMIQKMIFRLMAEQKDEDDHKNWCDLELEKTNTSKINKEDKIEELTSKIDAATAKIQKLAEDIKEATAMVSAIDAHVEKATEIREIGKKENALALKDSQDAQTAVASAIAVLEDFYKESGMMEKKAWELLQAPVELPPTPATWDASYTGVADPTNQPDGIIAIMKEVGSEFSAMEADTKAQEATDQEAYDQEMQDCSIEKARRSKEIEMKTQESKRLEDEVESLEKTKKHVSDELYQVNLYLKDLEPACVTGDSTYEDRKAARAKEIEALRQAQVILADAFKEAAAPAPAAAFLARDH